MNKLSPIKIAAIIFLIVAAIGLFETVYLTIEHYRGGVPPCHILSGCDVVLTSEFNNIFGIPVALLGAIYYFSMFLSAIVYFLTKNLRVMRVASYLTAIGMTATIYFVYLMSFVIKDACVYCITSAIFSTTLFVFGIFMLKKTRAVCKVIVNQ
jgi:uncharacterized membrane protein